MNHQGSHKGHMWLIGAIAAGALLFGYGVGSALALAVISCVVMLGAIVWFVQRDAQTPRHEQEHQDDFQSH